MTAFVFRYRFQIFQQLCMSYQIHAVKFRDPESSDAALVLNSFVTSYSNCLLVLIFCQLLITRPLNCLMTPAMSYSFIILQTQMTQKKVGVVICHFWAYGWYRMDRQTSDQQEDNLTRSRVGGSWQNFKVIFSVSLRSKFLSREFQLNQLISILRHQFF